MIASTVRSIPINLPRHWRLSGLARLIACCLFAVASLPGAMTQTVAISEFVYNPNPVNINVGDSVRWTNYGLMIHTATSDTPNLFDTGDLAAGDGFGNPGGSSQAIQFNAPGDFPYHCVHHPTQMMGVVHVDGPPPPVITSGTPPVATTGVAYTFTFTATSSTTVTWSHTGTFPGGLTLNATTGVLSGTPAAAGAFPNITVTAGNGSLPNATTPPFTMTVYDPPAITSAVPPNGSVGTAFTFTYTATGSAPIAFSATGLPPGLSLSSAGMLSGTPTKGGTFSGAAHASNPSSVIASQNFTIVISTPPTIISAPPTGAVQNTAYSYTVVASGSPTITFTATGLPADGLSISSGGVISGTPTTQQTITGTITASNGFAPDGNQNFSITVNATAIAPIITSAPPPGGQIVTPYSYTYTASGTANITYAVTTGALPTGMTLSSGGILAGTPSVAGTFTGTVTASNGTAPAATQDFSFAITSGGGNGSSGSHCGSGAKASLLMLGLLLLLRRFRG